VIGAPSPDHLVAIGVPARDLHLPRELHSRLDRFRAGRQIVQASVGKREALGKPVRKLFKRPACEHRGVRVRHFCRLLPDRVGNLLDAMPNVDDYRAAGGVDVALPLGIPQINALTMRDHRFSTVVLPVKNVRALFLARVIGR